MKRRGFFKAALALVGLKAIGADKKLLPNPDWVDANPEVLVAHGLITGEGWCVTTVRYEMKDGKWHKTYEQEGLD